MVDPAYRVGRHVLFILTLGIITFNQVFIVFQDSVSYVGSKIYFICLLSFATYLVTTYLHYFFLIPRFLLRERYMTYILCSLVFVFLLLCTGILLEYGTRTFLGLTHRIKSYVNPLILVDSLSTSAITIICFWSMSAVTLFRKWHAANDYNMALEYKLLASEVNKLKGQVSPVFLSQALQKAARLSGTNGDKASETLLQLGQLLRYQLYDCTREKVFLASEIAFIRQFLKLKQLISDDSFAYNVNIKGKPHHTLISPLLLLVLLQAVLINDAVTKLDLAVEILDRKIGVDFSFEAGYSLPDENRLDLHSQLDTLYSKRYTLVVQPGRVQLQLDLA